MNKSTIIAIAVGIIIILAVIVGIGSMMSKPSSTTSTTQSLTTQVTHTSQATITTSTTTTTSAQTTTTTTTTNTVQEPIVVGSTNLNLGVISPATGGSFCAPELSITVNEGGYYTFYLVNTQALVSEFSTFQATLHISNQTVFKTHTLGWYLIPSPVENKVIVYLSPGTYNLSIYLLYAAHSNATSMIFNKPIIELGNTPLANVSFAIQTQPLQIQLQTNPSIANATKLYLGTLTPSTGGSITVSSTITINKGGYYTLYLVNTQELIEEFSTFWITIDISNQTMLVPESHTLGWFTYPVPLWDKDTFYLSPGTYNISIKLEYDVHSNATSLIFNGTVVGIGYGLSPVAYRLVNVSFAIQANTSSAQQAIEPITMNLGILTPNGSATVTSSTTIIINKGGEYTFYLTNVSTLEKEFSWFEITISLANSSWGEAVSLGWVFEPTSITYNASIYLSPGSYSVMITLDYQVFSNATPISFNATVVKLAHYPLLNVSFVISQSTTVTQAIMIPLIKVE